MWKHPGPALRSPCRSIGWVGGKFARNQLTYKVTVGWQGARGRCESPLANQEDSNKNSPIHPKTSPRRSGQGRRGQRHSCQITHNASIVNNTLPLQWFTLTSLVARSATLKTSISVVSVQYLEWRKMRGNKTSHHSGQFNFNYFDQHCFGNAPPSEFSQLGPLSLIGDIICTN